MLRCLQHDELKSNLDVHNVKLPWLIIFCFEPNTLTLRNWIANNLVLTNVDHMFYGVNKMHSKQLKVKQHLQDFEFLCFCEACLLKTKCQPIDFEICNCKRDN